MLSQGQFFDSGRYSMTPTNAQVLQARTNALDMFPDYANTHGPAVTNSLPDEMGHDTEVGRFNTPAERIEMKTRKYYHGTDVKLNKGDYLTPGVEHGKDNYGFDRNESVFMTVGKSTAADWSRKGVHPSDTSYVYEVEPEGLQDKHYRATPEFQAQRARVLKRWAVGNGSGHRGGRKLTPMAEPKPESNQGSLF